MALPAKACRVTGNFTSSFPSRVIHLLSLCSRRKRNGAFVSKAIPDLQARFPMLGLKILFGDCFGSEIEFLPGRAMRKEAGMLPPIMSTIGSPHVFTP